MALKKALFHLIRYVPDAVRYEPINIGMILYEAECEDPKVAVRMTTDWSRLLYMCPDADIAHLQSMETELANMLRSRPEIDSSISHIKRQWTSPLELVGTHGALESHTVLFSDFDREVETLLRMYVDPPPRPTHNRKRMDPE